MVPCFLLAYKIEFDDKLKTLKNFWAQYLVKHARVKCARENPVSWDEGSPSMRIVDLIIIPSSYATPSSKQRIKLIVYVYEEGKFMSVLASLSPISLKESFGMIFYVDCKFMAEMGNLGC